MQEKQIVVSDQLINYFVQDSGDPTAPAVVFLHGWGADGKIWQGIMSKLSDYNCYALDLPGFGKSEMPKRTFTVGDYATIVKDFIENLELKSVALVGHSFGGRIAIKTTIAQNVSIQKLVLADSAGLRDDSTAKLLKIAVAKIAKPFLPAQFRKKIAKTFGAGDYTESGELRQTFLNIINEDLTEDMKRIKVPTLIIWGEKDKETPLKFGSKLHSYIPNSIFHILPSAGHFSFLDQPDQFLKILRSFLS